MSDRCGKCGGAMKEGFLLDASRNSFAVTHWAEGPPEYWFLKVLKLKGKQRHPVQSFRCSRCGFLESYARTSSE
jgi:hypothetical protein